MVLNLHGEVPSDDKEVSHCKEVITNLRLTITIFKPLRTSPS